MSWITVKQCGPLLCLLYRIKEKGKREKEKKGKKKVKQALCPHVLFLLPSVVRINSYGLENLGVPHPLLKLETFLDLSKQSYHSNSSFFP